MIRESMTFMYFKGNCASALAFYSSVLGADVIEKTTYEEAGMTDKDEEKPLIMNATFILGDSKFCANDVLDSAPVIGDNLSLWLEFEDEQALKAAYGRFQLDDCTVISALEETFWNASYAKVQDPFGVIWELNFQR